MRTERGSAVIVPPAATESAAVQTSVFAPRAVPFSFAEKIFKKRELSFMKKYIAVTVLSITLAALSFILGSRIDIDLSKTAEEAVTQTVSGV